MLSEPHPRALGGASGIMCSVSDELSGKRGSEWGSALPGITRHVGIGDGAASAWWTLGPAAPPLSPLGTEQVFSLF